jgi:hypothetical protein
MLRTALISIVVATSAPAAADPIAVYAALTARAQHKPMVVDPDAAPDYYDDEAHDDVAPAGSLAVGYRLPHEGRLGIAIGFRAAFARMEWQHVEPGSGGFHTVIVTRTYPFDLAATTELSYQRWWIAPSIGAQVRRETDTAYYLAFDAPVPGTGGRESRSETPVEVVGGLSLGFDVVQTRAGNVSLVVEAEASSHYAALGFGVAYRR